MSPITITKGGQRYRLVPYAQSPTAPHRVWIEVLQNGVWMPRRRLGIWDTPAAALRALEPEPIEKLIANVEAARDALRRATS